MNNYKKVLILSLIIFMGKFAYSQKSTDDFSGKWKTEEGSVIEISKKENGFIGLGVPAKKLIVKDLQFKDGKWVSEINNPIKNVTANGEFLIEGTRIKIVAKKSVFSKTLYWTKL
jgi:hypothetical protein